MVKKRNRAKQATTLEERLSKFTASLEEQAATTQPNTDQAIQLRKRLSSCETALRLNDTLNASR